MSAAAKQHSKHHGHREEWSGQFGFIMSAIGSAIGLGNIWRFPGVAYTNGGGAFLVPYIVALLTAGIPILLLDYALGHRYHGSSPTVFRRLGKAWESVGWFHVMICVVITSYYAVILAWAVRYVMFSTNLAWADDTTSFFLKDFLKVGEPGVNADIVVGIFIPLALVWIAAFIVMALGVTRGIERINRFFIPFLVVIFAALVIRALFLQGALDGLNAFFTPNWSALSDPGVWIAAYSQIFFSLSVGFGIMLTYSSYLKAKSNIVPTALVTGFANSSFEILAGIGVFATLGFMAAQQGVPVNELQGLSGPILSFVTFPAVISMMPGGPLFGIVFFLSLTIAGFTSLVSLLQVTSAAFQEKFGISRRSATMWITGVSGVASVFIFSTTDGLNALDVVDKYINELGIIGAAIVACVVVSFVLRRLPLLRAHLNYNSMLKLGPWWYAMVAVLVPAVLSVILVATVIELIKEPYGGYPVWFNATFGWAMIVGTIAASVIFSLLRWKTPVDDFDPMTFHGIEAAGGYNDSPVGATATEASASSSASTKQ
ncbi:sodium-dependent transporter [Arcanobacterium bovis]|uniref:Sodium-dependent transporter n=1 Tax=Arcanobacterium bovis TaxID=2529275 RepID=A0A4Q9V0Z5_9ACTO|nr:sodium-dependent transporter [Arcanobacterium bovis]TBW21060.1 sodium-dependent transporter [Arcanobacterium bovis]